MIDISDNINHHNVCTSAECEAHRYMMEKLSDIKEQMKVRDAECIDIKSNVIILTQSHNRLGEILEELKESRKEQDDKIEKNSRITAKLATVGSVLVVSIPLIIWALDNLQLKP